MFSKAFKCRQVSLPLKSLSQEVLVPQSYEASIKDEMMGEVGDNQDTPGVALSETESEKDFHRREAIGYARVDELQMKERELAVKEQLLDEALKQKAEYEQRLRRYQMREQEAQEESSLGRKVPRTVSLDTSSLDVSNLQQPMKTGTEAAADLLQGRPVSAETFPFFSAARSDVSGLNISAGQSCAAEPSLPAFEQNLPRTPFLFSSQESVPAVPSKASLRFAQSSAQVFQSFPSRVRTSDASVTASFGFRNNVSADFWSGFTPASSPFGPNVPRSTGPSFPSPSYGFSPMPGPVSLPGYGYDATAN